MLEGVARTKTCTNYKPKHHTVSHTDWSPPRRVLHHISIPPDTSRREPVKLGELCWYTDVYRIYKQYKCHLQYTGTKSIGSISTYNGYREANCTCIFGGYF